MDGRAGRSEARTASPWMAAEAQQNPVTRGTAAWPDERPSMDGRAGRSEARTAPPWMAAEAQQNPVTRGAAAWSAESQSHESAFARSRKEGLRALFAFSGGSERLRAEWVTKALNLRGPVRSNCTRSPIETDMDSRSD